MGNWYVREGGSNNNGGDSLTIAPERTGGGALVATDTLIDSPWLRQWAAGGSTTDQASYDLGTNSWWSGHLYLLAVTSTKASDPDTPTITTGVGGPTYTLRATTVVSNTHRVSVFSTVPTNDYTGSIQINFPAAQTGAMYSTAAYFGVDTSVGNDGIVQFATATGSSNAALVTLNSFASASNATFGAFGFTNTLALTNGSGFSTLDGRTIATPSAQQRTIGKNTSDTTVDVSWSGTMGWAGIALELAARPGSFSQADVGRAVCIVDPASGSGGSRWYRKIASVVDAYTATLHAATPTRSQVNWALGGAWASPEPTYDQQMADGDTVWVAPGRYRIPTIQPRSMGAMTFIRGDITGNAMGVGSGEVRFIGGSFTFASKKFWTLLDMTLRDCTVAMSGTASDITLFNLTMQHSSASRVIDCANMSFGHTQRITIDSCRVMAGYSGSGGGVIHLVAPTSASGTGDIDADVTVRNCIVWHSFSGNNDGVIIVGGTGTYKTGGFKFYNNTVYGGTSGVAFGVRSLSSGPISTVYPTLIYNNFVYGSGVGIQGNPFAAIIADYNWLITQNAGNGAGIGSNSIHGAGTDLEFSLGHEASFGGVTRPFMEPYQSSRLIGAGSNIAFASNDIYGVERPNSGTGGLRGAIGAYEHANSAYRERTIVPPDGGEALRIAGPGYQDFQLAVSSNLTPTVSVQARYDGTYTGILPQLWIVNGEEAGVASTSNTMTAGADTWEKVSVGPLAVTSNGIVTVRVQSLATASNAMAYFGSFGLE